MLWCKYKKSLFFHHHCALCLHSFIHKMNTVEFKSATFPNAGSRHLLDDSVMESHSPSRGQAESSTLSSGISLGMTRTNILNIMTQSLCHRMKSIWFRWRFVSIYREQRGLRAQRRGVLASIREVRLTCPPLTCFSITSTWKIIKKKQNTPLHMWLCNFQSSGLKMQLCETICH